jgi:hypothetical protein
MPFTARLLTLLAVISFLGACAHVAPPAATTGTGRDDRTAEISPPVADALQPASRALVGRILAVDAARGFAFVALTAAPPDAALADGAGFITRTDDLRETGRLRASRYIRGRTLGAQILSGQPAAGDEVVF